MFDKLKQYLHLYDPSHFSFYYTIKAIFSFSISLTIAYILNLSDHILFTILSSVFIFYMNVFDSTGFKKAAYFGLFILNSCCFIYFIDFFNLMGIWLFIPTFIWVFWVNFSQYISQDLFRVNIYSTILSFSALIFSQTMAIDIYKAILGVLVGGIVALLFRTISFYTYGTYTKRNFLMLLGDLEFMARYLNDKEFDILNAAFITHTNQIKLVFKSKSVKIKDPSFIKHHKLALFYLYKCEEIGAMLLSLRSFFKRNKTNSHILSIQDELCYNINQLKHIFKDDKEPKLCKRRYEIVKSLGVLPRLCDLMEVMFFKLELFINSGQVVLEEENKTKSYTIYQKIKIAFQKAISNQENIKLSIKTALAASLGIFIALFFELDHGIWVAIGIFSLLKARKNATKIAIFQTITGVLIGFFVGYLLILIFKDTKLFLPIVFLSYFACVYFKHFPYTISLASIMANLALFFAFARPDFEKLILYRILDLGISFAIVLFISYFVWPSKSEDDIVPSILDIIDKQTKLINTQESKAYLDLQGDISLALNNLSNTINECQNKTNYFKYHKILQSLNELNLSVISLYSYVDGENKMKDYKVLSDIRLLSTRFDMIKNMTNALPYYFYDEVRSKLSSQNPKMVYFLLLVAKKQDELYKNIKTIL